MSNEQGLCTLLLRGEQGQRGKHANRRNILLLTKKLKFKFTLFYLKQTSDPFSVARRQ